MTWLIKATDTDNEKEHSFDSNKVLLDEMRGMLFLLLFTFIDVSNVWCLCFWNISFIIISVKYSYVQF